MRAILKCLAPVLLSAASAWPCLSQHASARVSASVEDLRNRNLRNADSVKRCTRLDRLVIREKELPGEMDEHRANLTEGTEENLASIVRQMEEAGATDEQLEHMRSDFEERIAMVPDIIVGMQLRKRYWVLRKSAIDFEGTRARYGDSNLRYFLSADDTEGISTVEAQELSGSVRVTGAPVTFNTERERLMFGIIPARIFDSGYRLERKESSERRGRNVDLVAYDRETRNIVYVVTVRTDLGCLLTRLRRYDAEGNLLEQFSASDFRRVDGVYVPHKTRQQHSREGVEDYRVEETFLESIELNPTLPESIFDRPPRPSGSPRPTTQPARPG